MSDDSGSRLAAIQGELASILESRLNELNQAVAGTEAATRRILAAELEIERHRAGGARHEEQIAALETELAETRVRAQEVREQHGEMLSARDKAREDLVRLEREVRDADSEVEKTRERVKGMENEAGTLRTENAALKTKLRTLEENISRMKRLKEELMHSISGLTQQMSGLAGGGNE